MDTRSQVIHTYLLLSTALLAQMLLCQIEGFNSAILDYQVWAGLQGVEQELNTCNRVTVFVELLIATKIQLTMGAIHYRELSFTYKIV